MTRELADFSLRALRERLGGTAALPFAEAVALQLAHPPGVAGAAEAERAAVERVIGALERTDEQAARWLASDPELLAALFQNVDLLYAHGYPGADSVSLLVMRALEETEHVD